MKVLLNDSSVLLNLLAAECIESISNHVGWQFAICPAVRDEAKKLRDAHTLEMVEVDITPLIASGILHVLELANDAERALYVEQSINVDDGEAMSIAIAATRHLELAIDDKQASNHASRSFPELRIWGTPDILKCWADLGHVKPAALREAIRLIELRARYFPSRTHALSSWWQSMKHVEG